MNVTTEQSGNVAIVRVGETRMMYPMLAEFSDTVSALVSGGARHILDSYRAPSPAARFRHPAPLPESS